MCDGFAAIGSAKRTRRLKRKRMTDWFLLRIGLLLLAISSTVYVTIPDYPWGTPLWLVLTMDPGGWLHEVFYIWTFCLVGIDLTYHFEKRSKEV